MSLITRAINAFLIWLFIIGLIVVIVRLSVGPVRADDLERIPDEAVAQTFADVARILTEQGYQVRPDTVPVYFKRLSGVDGMTVAGVIVINSESIPACFRSILAHEAVHALLGRDAGMTPNQSERLARALERLVSHDYTPNCWSPAL